MKLIGLAEADVRRVLQEEGLEWEDFRAWIYRQTRPLAPDGTSRYYSHDVWRFVAEKAGK